VGSRPLGISSTGSQTYRQTDRYSAVRYADTTKPLRRAIVCPFTHRATPPTQRNATQHKLTDGASWFMQAATAAQREKITMNAAQTSLDGEQTTC